MKNRQLYRLAACLIGAASLLLQSCSESRFKDCDRLCGSWSSVEGKPDVLIYKEGDAYKVNTGYRIDIAYNEAADVLTFSPNGDYVRKEVRP